MNPFARLRETVEAPNSTESDLVADVRTLIASPEFTKAERWHQVWSALPPQWNGTPIYELEGDAAPNVNGLALANCPQPSCVALFIVYVGKDWRP